MKGTTFYLLCTLALAKCAVLVKDGENPVINDDPSQAPAICAAPASSGVLVAHEHCNKYYICTHGSPVAKQCPAQLLYDPQHKRCEWPHTVKCGDRVIPDEDDESSEEQVTESIGNGNDDPSQAQALCATEGSDHSYVAHEICNMFYQCWAGQPVPLKCPAGFLWNPKKNYCDFPSNVNCRNRMIRDEDDEVVSKEVVIPEVEIPVGDNNDDPSQANKICASPDSSGILIAHEYCNRYYICNHGRPVARRCPLGLLFDPTRDRCEWPDIVNCGDRIISDEDDVSEEEKVTESSGNVNDDPSQAAVLCAAEGSDNSYVAHEKCDMFYQCWAGKPVPLPCPVGTLWNPKKSYCDFPYNVDCGDRLVL